MKTQGMIVKVKSNSCIVLTPEGDYREVPLLEGSRARVGQEIEIPQRKTLPYFRFLMVAASLLVVVVLAGRFFPLAPPPAAAYLTIDINPSVELGVTSSEKVISARGLNSDGEQILAKVAVRGLKLQDAVARIVSQAVTDQFLCDLDDNIILATLTVEEDQDPLVELDVVYEAIEKPVKSGGILAEIIIEPVTPKMREDATKTGLSTGKFLVLKKSGEKGVPVSADELGGSSLGNLEKANEISIIELIRGNGKDAEEKNVEAVKNAKPGKARSGIYYDGRKKAPDFEIITGGKTIKAGAEHEQDKNKSESPGKSDVKRRDNSKFVPGNNDYFSDNKNNNSDNKNKDKDNKNNNRNDNKNKDNKTNDSDKNNNNKDKNYNDRSIKDIKNNDKRDEKNYNDSNYGWNNKDKSNNVKNNHNDNNGDDNTRSKWEEKESWIRQKTESTENETGFPGTPLRWPLEFRHLNLHPSK